MALGFYGLKAEVLIHALEQKGIYVSAGSACSSNKQGKSHVLQAINVPEEYEDGTIRISFSYKNTEEEVEYVADKVVESYNELKQYGRR